MYFCIADTVSRLPNRSDHRLVAVSFHLLIAAVEQRLKQESRGHNCRLINRIDRDLCYQRLCCVAVARHRRTLPCTSRAGSSNLASLRQDQ